MASCSGLGRPSRGSCGRSRERDGDSDRRIRPRGRFYETRSIVKCKETRGNLSRYLDRELSVAAAVSVEEHLAQCLECRTEHEAQRRLWALLGRAEPIPSPDLVAAVAARLSERGGWASFLAGLRLRSIGYATATAALVGLFVWAGAWAGTMRQDPDRREPDRAFTELLSDAPPGMEVVAVLDQIGERP